MYYQVKVKIKEEKDDGKLKVSSFIILVASDSIDGANEKGMKHMDTWGGIHSYNIVSVSESKITDVISD